MWKQIGKVNNSTIKSMVMAMALAECLKHDGVDPYMAVIANSATFENQPIF